MNRKKKMRSKDVLIFIVFLLVVSCKNKRPTGILSPSKLEDVLYDYHIARSIAGLNGDSIEFRRMEYTEAVFHRYGISRAEFDSSMLWYSRHTNELYKVYQNIDKRLNKEASLLGIQTNNATSYSQLSDKGDTANVWKGRDFYCLTTKDANNLLSFNIKADTSYYPQDRLLWNFRSRYVYQSGRRDAIVSLSVRYDNDSVGTVTQHLGSDGEYSISLDVANRKIKRVNGFVYHNAQWTKEEKILIIDNLSLVRFHKKKEMPLAADTASVADSAQAKPSPVTADSLPPIPDEETRHAAPIPARRRTIQTDPYNRQNFLPRQERSNN